MKKAIQNLAWILIFIGGIISIVFLAETYKEGYRINGNQKIDFSMTGQFGDYIGGVVGTVFALAGTFLIFLTFTEQTKQNKREAFEAAFFEMVHLHRENLAELKYTTYNEPDMNTAENRKVFRVIFREFLDCFREVKRFSNSKKVEDYLQPKYRLYLENIIKENNPEIDIIELAIIDIAYSIIFFGLGDEGEIVLRHNFQRRYNSVYFYGLLRYLKLKPKRENFSRWHIWKKLFSMPYNEFKRVNEEFYKYRKHLSPDSLSPEAAMLVYTIEFEKYYGGHQHRLGHYFRHLFQSYKYLNYHPDLSDEQKYFYGKTLRAQLSTYEQALLFINSISSLGRKWELTPEVDLTTANIEDIKNSKLITRYNLIKNLPGSHFFGLRYKTFYPHVTYETED